MRNGKQLAMLIDDILDLSKVEAGHLKLELEKFKPEKLLLDVVTLLSLNAKQKNIELDYVVRDDTPSVVCSDPHRVRQILLNLVSNSVKFTEEGSVKVSCRPCTTKNHKRNRRGSDYKRQYS